jgi:hypothetical protein
MEVIDVIHLYEEVLDYEWSEDEKENDELHMGQHYCGRFAGKMTDITDLEE